MASTGKRVRPAEGIYREIGEGSGFKSERIPRKCKRKSDKEMYEVQVIDRDRKSNKIKLHYIGYSDDYDEWRNCEEIKETESLGQLRPRFSPSSVSLEDRASLFCDRLAKRKKNTLYPGKKESPEIKIEEIIDNDVYNSYFKNVGIVRTHRGRNVHCINSTSDPELCNLLGEKWFERIINKNVDFCYVIKGTIQFWLYEKSAVKEYITVGNQLFVNHIKNDFVLMFTFVRGDGVKNEYFKNTWK